jgi:hypothetical protein
MCALFEVKLFLYILSHTYTKLLICVQRFPRKGVLAVIAYALLVVMVEADHPSFVYQSNDALMVAQGAKREQCPVILSSCGERFSLPM